MAFEWPHIAPRLGFYLYPHFGEMTALLDWAAEQNVGWVVLDVLNPAWFPDQIKSKTLKAIKKQVKKNKLKLAIRAPHDLDFLSLHHNIHQAVMSRTIEFIEMSMELEAAMMLFSLPDLDQLPAAAGFEPSTALFANKIEDALTRSLHILYAFSEEMPVCLVNTSGHLLDPLLQKSIEDSLQKEEISLCLDTARIFVTGQTELEFFKAQQAHIKMCLLHNADDSGDHLPVIQGQVEFAPFLELIAAQGEIPLILKGRSQQDLAVCLDAFRERFCTND